MNKTGALPLFGADASRGPDVVSQVLDRFCAEHDVVLIGPDDTGLLDAAAAALQASGARVVRVAAASDGPLTVSALVAQLTGANDVTAHDDATLERAFQSLSATEPGGNGIVLIVGGADRLHRSAIRYLDFTTKTSPHLRLFLVGPTDPAPAFEPAAPTLHRRLTAMPAVMAARPAVIRARPIPPAKVPPLLLAPRPRPSPAPALQPKPAETPSADAEARLAPALRTRSRKRTPILLAVAACVVAGAGIASLALRPARPVQREAVAVIAQPTLPVAAAGPDAAPAPLPSPAPVSLADAIAPPALPPPPEFAPDVDSAAIFTPPAYAPPPSVPEAPKREARQAPRRAYQRQPEPRRAYYGDGPIARAYEPPAWRTPYAYVPPFAGGAEQPSIGTYVLMPDGRRVFRLNR